MTVVGVVIRSARDLWPVVALMMLMCFVFTVLGMQLFGATLNPDLEAYAERRYAFKTRFDTFFWSVVQVKCVERWVGLGWIGLGWVGLGWAGLGWVGLG